MKKSKERHAAEVLVDSVTRALVEDCQRHPDVAVADHPAIHRHEAGVAVGATLETLALCGWRLFDGHS